MQERHFDLPTKYMFFMFVVCSLITLTIGAYIYFGSVISCLIFIPMVLALAAWMPTTFHKPVEPRGIVVCVILAISAIIVQDIEEWLHKFPQVITGLFPHLFPVEDLFSERLFLSLFSLLPTTLFVLTTYGLYLKHPLSNYMTWFIFIWGIVGGLASFAFPILAHGSFSYFPGQWTAPLPIIMGLYGIKFLCQNVKKGEG